MLRNVRLFMWLGGALVATVEHDMAATGPGAWETTWRHDDHLGSAQVGTSAAGLATFQEYYTPFGEVENASPANADRAGFTGHIRDTATGLTYMQARYQHPVTGRFLSVDPVDFLADGRTGMVNRYSYTLNDPMNGIDPNGEQFFDFGADEKVSQYSSDPDNSTSMTEDGPASSTLNPSGAMNSVNNALGAGGMAVAEGYANGAFEAADMASNEVLSSAMDGDAAGVGIGIASAAIPVRAKGKSQAIKSLASQAADLVGKNAGKARVTLRSPSTKMELDLTGKSHGGVATPHVKVSPRNMKAPNQPAYNTKSSPVRAATQQDIRTARRYLERNN